MAAMRKKKMDRVTFFKIGMEENINLRGYFGTLLDLLAGGRFFCEQRKGARIYP
jgi:hypothetical protein